MNVRLVRYDFMLGLQNFTFFVNNFWNVRDPERCYGEGGGRGFVFGNACTPVVDSCQCMAKPIQYCQVK